MRCCRWRRAWVAREGAACHGHVHCAQLPEERLHANGERTLRPLNLSDEQRADVVVFFRRLRR